MGQTMSKVYRGTVLRWNDEKGFGFIKPEDGGGDVFVHRSELPNGDDRSTRLYIDDEVEYEEGEQKGKMCAQNVEILKRSEKGDGGGGGRGGRGRDDSRGRGRGRSPP